MKTSGAVLADVEVLGNYTGYENAENVENKVEFEVIKNDAEVKEELYSLACANNRNIASTYIARGIQRFIDILAGIAGVFVLMLLIPVVWVANKLLKDDGPIFYSQERIGKDGNIFKIYKFRSMIVGADEKLKEYLSENKEAAEEYKKYKKLKHDPRITPMGKFLRKTSLDEIPQLINVLNGTMSLVGPRPYLPREKKDMGTYYDVIIMDKPGITGLWQISGRSNTTFDERLDYDVMFHKQKCFKNYIVILFKTFVNVFKKEGAI